MVTDMLGGHRAGSSACGSGGVFSRARGRVGGRVRCREVE